VEYIPSSLTGQTPTSVAVMEELRKISYLFSQLGIRLEFNPIDSIPTKLHSGLVIYADGTNVDPLSNGVEGLYLYTSSGWVSLISDTPDILGVYRTILSVASQHTAARVAGKYGFGYQQAAFATGVAIANPIAIVGIYAADYPSIAGLTPKLRIRAQVNVNDVAPTGNYTFGLYPITRPATSGGAGNMIYTMGTVVSGSTGATVSTPAADSQTSLVSSDFSLPADGQYILGMVTTATVAANSHMHLNAQLQLHYV
jgi:hypothetical protein